MIIHDDVLHIVFVMVRLYSLLHVTLIISIIAAPIILIIILTIADIINLYHFDRLDSLLHVTLIISIIAVPIILIVILTIAHIINLCHLDNIGLQPLKKGPHQSNNQPVQRTNKPHLQSHRLLPLD